MSNGALTCYEILEVHPRASAPVIEAAYKAIMKRHYPNGINGDDRIARSLNAARETLIDMGKRSAYDDELVKKGERSVSQKDLIGKTVGDYRVLELIAEGGFGKTYKGEHLLLNTPVCIKHGHEISPQDEAILVEEARAIWDLRHYGIPSMRGFLKLDDGSPMVIMSYIPGRTLEQLVDYHSEKKQRLDPEHVAWIIERSLNVLKYLHYHGIVHGDVKPQNIIVQKDHHLALVDYGLSAIKPTSDSRNKGFTPYFAAPEEEASGDNPLLPESDFYGLGMTMIYALGGDVRSKKVPSSVPDALCAFIKRLIVRDVSARPRWPKNEGEEDICDTIKKVRKEAFGRSHSNMRPIPGL
ncbi:MAG TPA: protein kinase [Candidatus Nanoarchaeia archaeon]|nr:protein kinase [Candidatus Nanoarchaeia archaeon]